MVTSWFRSRDSKPWRHWRADQGGEAARVDRPAPGTAPAPDRRLPREPRGAFPIGIGSSRPRRLLFINQYYWPDHASTAQHLTDLAESLAVEGHEVHVLCAQGRYQPGAPRPPAREVHNGVQIHRVPATSLGRRN